MYESKDRQVSHPDHYQMVEKEPHSGFRENPMVYAASDRSS